MPTGVYTRILRDVAERFWSKVTRSDECWPFNGATNESGYGVVSFKGKARLAHRVSWVLTHGEIGDGLLICHHCDNPPCVRPDHLFAGSQSANLYDMASKGRYGDRDLPCGERNHNAKLTIGQVGQIRALHADGATVTSLARQFDIARSTTHSIVVGDTWIETP